MESRALDRGIKTVLLLAGIGSFGAVHYKHETNKANNINNLNKEIQMKDSARYSNLVKAGKTKDIDFLEAQAKRMNDSLKLDSIAKKAYFEGAKMMKDSLQKAPKVVK